MKLKKPKYNYIMGLDFNEKEAGIVKKAAIEGNTQAKLDIILHNQHVFNYKLNKIINSK